MNKPDNSPFTPGYPVPVELFVGRSEQIKQLIKYIKNSLSGRQENVFLAGERGIGKSSVGSFLQSWAAKNLDVLGLHVFLGGVSSVDDMVRRIFDQLLKEATQQPWYEKVSALFGSHIQQIGLFGVSVSFSPPKENLRALSQRFPEALAGLWDKIKDNKKGLIIILDDINGLAQSEDFANWYKSFVDMVATGYKHYPVFMMLIGLPERRDSLARLQPSLMRIFRVTDIHKLDDEEVKQFFERSYEKANMTLHAEALNFMVRFSGGLPMVMQEIGDAAFWLDKDGVVDFDDALMGVMFAAENIGKKHLDPKVYRAIRSKNYLSILRKLPPLIWRFTRRDVEPKLNANEKKVFHNFIKRFRELGVIEPDPEEGRGAYRFVNQLYPIYIGMEAETAKRRRR